MKIVYVGQLYTGGTCRMRLSALRRSGADVIPIDTSPPQCPGPVARAVDSIAFRIGYPVDWAKANGGLIRSARTLKPDIVWVDKGSTISRSTLVEIKSYSPRITTVHFNPDDPFGSYGKAGWRTFLASIDAYDLHFVPRKVNVSEYGRYGARKVISELPARGFDPELHRPAVPSREELERFEADVGFIGTFESSRARLIQELGSQGINVRVFGSGWPQSLTNRGVQYVTGGMSGAQYAAGLRCFKIALCFLRKGNRDLHTSRSIEIPACGVFMLAERTDEHQALFEEGKEAEFFSSTDELMSKARFYLKDEVARTAIARAGRIRCEKSGYSYDDLMRRRLAFALSTEPH